MRAAHLLASGLLASMVAGWLLWPETPVPPSAPAPAPAAAAAVSAPVSARPGSAAATLLADRGDGIERVPNLPVDQSQSATASLADAHLRGDPRTPPLVRAAEALPEATDAEKADPQAYAAYEARQNGRVYARFNQAANQMLPQLRADIERGRQLGIAPEKIARAEEKYRRIAEEQANILKKYPELAGGATR